ncbi:MAG: nucleotidyltransferase domain-containing protein [Bacteroides sp.]|nr:nucleotidyltransferase domain-containing protein [Eubacterium sp.]MCM1419039.1 nucleotidyltransferase domain-containing protein [Roseburia sp.]MCM1463403.1 nucleotidyltransferase domain-containing protein [Bacteroides sp.]
MGVYKIEEIAERVRPIAERYGTGKIYLFGSYARGEATEESDIDLLVDAENVIGLQFFGMYGDLEEALQKELDLITTNALYDARKTDRLTVKLRDGIERDRRLIYDRPR